MVISKILLGSAGRVGSDLLLLPKPICPSLHSTCKPISGILLKNLTSFDKPLNVYSDYVKLWVFKPDPRSSIIRIIHVPRKILLQVEIIVVAHL